MGEALTIAIGMMRSLIWRRSARWLGHPRFNVEARRNRVARLASHIFWPLVDAGHLRAIMGGRCQARQIKIKYFS
jgi:hypothetical protein